MLPAVIRMKFWVAKVIFSLSVQPFLVKLLTFIKIFFSFLLLSFYPFRIRRIFCLNTFYFSFLHCRILGFGLLELSNKTLFTLVGLCLYVRAVLCQTFIIL